MKYQAIAESIKDCGIFTGEFETMNYSGRAMYGEECLAISGNVWRVAVTLAKYAEEKGLCELSDFLKSYTPKTDSLGYDTVIYWPNLPALDDNSEWED